MKLLNLHGYQASAENAAFLALKKCGYEVVSPQLDYDKSPPDLLRRRCGRFKHGRLFCGAALCDDTVPCGADQSLYAALCYAAEVWEYPSGVDHAVL